MSLLSQSAHHATDCYSHGSTTPKPPKSSAMQKHFYLQGSTKIKGFSSQPPKSSIVPDVVNYRVCQSLRVLSPNLPFWQRFHIIYRVPQRLKVLAPNLPMPKVPQCQTLLFTGFGKALRFWTHTSPEFLNAKAKCCYLQGPTKIKGFGPKPPRSATPNTVICTRGFGEAQGFGPKSPAKFRNDTAIYISLAKIKGCGPQTSQKFRNAKHCCLQGSRMP